MLGFEIAEMVLLASAPRCRLPRHQAIQAGFAGVGGIGGWQWQVQAEAPRAQTRLCWRQSPQHGCRRLLLRRADG